MSGSEESPSLVYSGSLRKIAAFVGLLLLFAWACSAKHGVDDSWNRLSWGLALVTVIVALVLVIQAIRGLPRLTLSRGGFEISVGLTSKKYGWSECGDFVVKDFFGPTTIVFVRKGFGSEGALLNLYSASSREISESLNAWCERYSHGA